MKFGIAFANTARFSTGPGAIALATGAEAAGFESLWTVEHVIHPEGYGSTYPYDPSGKMPGGPHAPIPDPLIWLAYLAAVTSTIRLGTGILILPERNPVVLAKEVATLDSMSGGRVELGIGVGWLKEEFAALGIPWERRGARTDEYVAAMRTLWSGEICSFDGEFASWQTVASNPTPTDRSVPVVIGGHSNAAAARAGRIGDGFFPAKGNLPEMLDVLRDAAAAANRNPDDIEISFTDAALFGNDPAEGIETLEALGVSRAILPAYLFMKNTEESLIEWSEKLGISGS